MPTPLETTSAIQEKVFHNLQVSQRAMVDVVRSWAETVDLVFSKLPELSVDPAGRPNQFFETTLGFTEKVLGSQRDFANQIFDAATPATRSPQSAAQSAKTASQKV